MVQGGQQQKNTDQFTNGGMCMGGCDVYMHFSRDADKPAMLLPVMMAMRMCTCLGLQGVEEAVVAS